MPELGRESKSLDLSWLARLGPVRFSPGGRSRDPRRAATPVRVSAVRGNSLIDGLTPRVTITVVSIGIILPDPTAGLFGKSAKSPTFARCC